MNRPRSWILLPVVIAVAAHARSLTGEFVWDDTVYVEWLRSSAGSRDAAGDYFRPLLHYLGLAIHLAAGVERPWVWHLVNVILHAGTVAGVYALLRVWSPPPPDRVPGPVPPEAVGATLFAIWPTSMEAVTWVSARTELLMGLCIVWGVVLQLRARDRGGWPIGAAVLHLGALLSKEVGAVFLPLAMAATLLVPAPAALAPESTRSRRLRLLLPHLAVLGVYGLLRSQAVGPGASLTALAVDRLRPEALGPALYAWGWYVREGLLFGSGSPYVEAPAPAAITWCFALAGLLALAALADAGRRPGGRPWALAGAWFVLALAPPLAFAASPVSITPMAVRYLYVPSIALCAWIALALQRWSVRLDSPVSRGAAAAVLVLLLAIGWHRQSPWLSDEALWTRGVRDYPRSSIAHLNLGLVLVTSGDAAAGEEHLRFAAFNPDLPNGPTKQLMLVRVGEYYMAARRFDQAEEAFSHAVRLHGRPATSSRAREGLRAAIEFQRRTDSQ